MKNKISCLIVDDEKNSREVLKKLLNRFADKLEVVGMAVDAEDAFNKMEKLFPELIFLDIQMPKLNGFEMLEVAEHVPSVIFTTAFDEYAMKAFDANAIDYLLKPFSKDRFDQAMQKWLNQHHGAGVTEQLLNSPMKHPEEQNRIAVKFGSNISIIPAADIYYIEAYDDYVKIFTEKDYFLKKKTMNYFVPSAN